MNILLFCVVFVCYFREPERLQGDNLPVDEQWDEIFMQSALKVSERSPDTNTKVPEVHCRCALTVPCNLIDSCRVLSITINSS